MTRSKKLRFAPLIRVSTEKQEQQGESLNTQKKQILQAVESLDGTIPDRCWQYSGQEHATPEQEREKLEKLLRDSGKGLFDAVIVCDATRWSRDNRKSKEGLEVLKDNGICFFIGAMEMDLFNPEIGLFLGMSVEIGEFQANQQARKSMLSRIERAKRNRPTSGELPFGRTYDKKTNTWGIDEDKKRQIENGAEQYLGGESLKKIAKMLNMNHSNLTKVLRERCGDKWTIKFRMDKFKIHEDVTLTIPRLLPESTIRAIHKRARANRTYLHGQPKHRYLLGRMIFCGHCDFALHGQTIKNIKYYRHPWDRGCKKLSYVPGDLLEKAVFAQVFEVCGDRVKMEEAAKQAIPDLREVKRLRKQIERNQIELKKISISKDRLLDKVEKGIIEDEDLRERMVKLKERERLLKSEIEQIQSELRSIPTKEDIIRFAQLMLTRRKRHFKTEAHLHRMKYEDKRALLQNLFGGIDKDGKRYGIYVEKLKKKGVWIYTTKWGFMEEVGRVESGDKLVKQNMHGNYQISH